LSYFDPISASEAEIAFEPLQAHPLGSFPGFFSGVFVDVAGEALLPISLAVVDFPLQPEWMALLFLRPLCMSRFDNL
jgi:hypothetical protein